MTGIDLHCHSTVSDGDFLPEEVVSKAATSGCRVLALTDHDHTGGIAAARNQAALSGITLISGVEVSVTWRSRTLHIVGLDFDESHAGLQDLLTRIRSGRVERLRAIAQKLEKRGITGAFEGALAYADTPETVSRTHVARYLVENGFVRNKEAAFRKYLGAGKSCDVPHRWATLEETVTALLAAGGVPVIAHPMRYDLSATAKRNLFDEFKELGGQAIEVHSSTTTANDRLNYTVLANRHGLAASLGSDFHSDRHFGSSMLGNCPPLPPGAIPVWTRFSRTRIEVPVAEA